MERTRFIVAGKFIDGSGTDVRRNIFLAVKDTIITAIGSATDLPCTNGTAIDDFSHYTILPALIDCSVSLTQSPSVDKRVQLSSDKSDLSEKAALLERHSNYYHTHGVQGVVDSSESTGLVESYQTMMAQGSRIASQLPRKLSYLEGIYIEGEPSTTYHKTPIKAVSQERFTPSANDCPRRPSQ